jgi:DTW domain
MRKRGAPGSSPGKREADVSPRAADDASTGDGDAAKEVVPDSEEQPLPGKPRDPFAAFPGLWSREPLARLSERHACAFCGRKNKYYCYFCCVCTDPGAASAAQQSGTKPQIPAEEPGFSKAEIAARAKAKVYDYSTIPVREALGGCSVTLTERRARPDGVPLLTDLGVRIDIVHHFLERRGKSTAIHAKVLAPDCVRFFDYPDFPDYRSAGAGGAAGSADDTPQLAKTLLLFPKEGSRTVGEMTADEVNAVESIVVVDSTWAQAKHILADPRLSTLPCVRLGSEHRTEFWRYQDMGEDHLATIEVQLYVSVHTEHVTGLSEFIGKFC